MMRLWILALPLLLFMAGCASQRPPPGAGHFVARSVNVGGQPVRYRVYVPAAARLSAGSAPVVLFLHGSGERGSNNRSQIRTGLGPYLRDHPMDFPAIVVFPQVPDDQAWTGPNINVALAALEAATAEFGGDRTRTYVTGMSMGGYGTWEAALTQPHRFAAIAPVCGAVHAPPEESRDLRVTLVDDLADPYTSIAQRLRHVPVWMFHGAEDDVVPPQDDRKLFAAFRANAGTARYTEYPDGNHNAWDDAYGDPALWRWLFKQHLP
ncbi:MAG: prolyl oligopeptidase family serine peptidase [Pseudoxanthomonas sp.]